MWLSDSIEKADQYVAQVNDENENEV